MHSSLDSQFMVGLCSRNPQFAAEKVQNCNCLTPYLNYPMPECSHVLGGGRIE